MSPVLDSFRPGRPWLDTAGERIQAHAGSILHEDGVYYWYGEDKSRTKPGSGIWHWGVRCYSSTDLYNWTDLGSIIPPDEHDPSSPLHPSAMLDRPHILRDPTSGLYVCWVKVMRIPEQLTTVLVAERLTGPWRIVRKDFRPLGMNAGDFDLVVDPSDGKAYYYFDRVHSELICADLTEDRTDVTGYYSTHLPRRRPPFVREAPAYFRRQDRHYLLTSGTTGYAPNPTEVATAEMYHGPWVTLGLAHPGDPTRTSYRSQISSVFKHPEVPDLYIALGDRWLPNVEPELADQEPQDRSSSVDEVDEDRLTLAPSDLNADTSIADYVWLPLRFDGEIPRIDWLDEWRISDFS